MNSKINTERQTMSTNEKSPESPAPSASRGYVWFRSCFSWPAWYRWMHGMQDCEIKVQEKDRDKRKFLVVADSPKEALQAIIVPRLGEKCKSRVGRCVELKTEVWLPDFCFVITATYR